MKGRPFRERLGFALKGIATGWRREASFRSQTSIGALALLVLLVLQPQPIWWALVALVVGSILAFELVNAALEGVVDLLHPGIHPEIKAIKDMAAGAVLLLSMAAIAIGVAMLVECGPVVLREWGLK